MTYSLFDGEPLQVLHDGEPVSLSLGSPILRPTRKTPPSDPLTQPRNREPLRRRAVD